MKPRHARTFLCLVALTLLACSSDEEPAETSPTGGTGGTGAVAGAGGSGTGGGGVGGSGGVGNSGSGGTLGGTAGTDTGGTGTAGSGGGASGTGGSAGVGTAGAGQAGDGGVAGEAGSPGGGPGTGGSGGGTSTSLRFMSLNIYGYATMPDAAPTYAALINGLDIDVLGIQEGVEDWQISGLPTDYSRAEALHDALGACWDRHYQIFVNTCRGASFVSHERFDMTDGPNAVRTGEIAIIGKNGENFAFIDVHWDHESAATRTANANETAAVANQHTDLPTVVVGDFNSACTSAEPSSMAGQSDLTLIVNGGIDCIFSRNAPGSGTTVDASPSDHPGAYADLTI
jgi:hypothetical protein